MNNKRSQFGKYEQQKTIIQHYEWHCEWQKGHNIMNDSFTHKPDGLLVEYYAKIGNVIFKCTLWIFQQQLALKCECVVESYYSPINIFVLYLYFVLGCALIGTRTTLCISKNLPLLNQFNFKLFNFHLLWFELIIICDSTNVLIFQERF